MITWARARPLVVRGRATGGERMLTLAAVMILNVATPGAPESGPTQSAPQAVMSAVVEASKARELADSFVQSVLRDRYAAVRASMERAFRDAVPEAGMRSALDRMYQVYGKPLEAEYKMQEEGYRLYPDGTRKPMQKVWYAIRTAEHAKGKYFLFVEVVPDGKSLACASMMIVTFAGDPPSRLK
jgi:hypothetical protein